MTSKIPSILIVVFPFLLALPFINRAYFVDDHYHVLMAKGILQHLSRPYDFRADDNGLNNVGWERGQPPSMINPPLHHYFLAALIRLGGEKESWLRFGVLWMSGMSLFFIFNLAKRLGIPAFWSVVFCGLTPAFWLTSYSLLIDSTLLCFFLAATLTWILGLEKDSALWLHVSGILMGLTALVKYTGLSVILLAVFWLYLKRHELPRGLRHKLHIAFAFLWPLLIIAAWSTWNYFTYGEAHLWASAQRAVSLYTIWKALVVLIFFSGSLLFPWLLFPVLFRRPYVLWKGLLIGGGGILLGFLMRSPWGGFTEIQALQIAVSVVSSLLFFALVMHHLKDHFATQELKFILAWLILMLGMTFCVMPWVSVRYFLLLLPPSAFLFLKILWTQQVKGSKPVGLFLGACFLFLMSGSIAYADYWQAETGRKIVRDVLQEPFSGREKYYLGDSFTGSYLKYIGWQPAFEFTTLTTGALLLKQEVTMPRWWYRGKPIQFQLIKTYTYATHFPIKVMDNEGSAGFYASVWGALPFTFSTGPWERFQLLEVIDKDR